MPKKTKPKIRVTKKVKIFIAVFVVLWCALFTAVGMTFLFNAFPVNAVTYTVNSTVDDDDGTCIHPYVDADNDCTLREAINEVNDNSGADTIIFDIDAAFSDDGDGQWTITLGSALPEITDALSIDATGAWDTDDDRPGIFVTSALTTGSIFDFGSGSDDSSLMGLKMSGMGIGIDINAPGIVVGTNCDGSDDAIERNVIYSTATGGILINDVSSVKIKGNYIGVQEDGVSSSTFGNYGVSIYGADADGNLIGFEEGTSGTCAPAIQRNVIGGGNGEHNGVYITSSEVTDYDGDSTLAPNGNIVAGNYVGVGSDGLTNIAGNGNGVMIDKKATLNIVGSDGDGIEDGYEGNVTSGWGIDGFTSGCGIYIYQTGYNRASGNISGLSADLSTAVSNSRNGVSVSGNGNIIGWCDSSIDSDLCSDGGSVDDQRNAIASNLKKGVNVAMSCDSCVLHGNIIGTDDTSGSTDFGNGEEGILIHKSNSPIYIGTTSTTYGNVVMYNGKATRGGIKVAGFYSGSNSLNDPAYAIGPTEDYYIQYNTVVDNDDYGIYILGTEDEGTAGPTDGYVVGNIVSSNAKSGILVEGSSPLVSDNTIEGNTEYGIYVSSAFRPDYPDGGDLGDTVYDHPTDSLNPNELSHDCASEPIITGNTIDSNVLDGIYILDAQPSNDATLATDNTIGTNGTYDIRKDWYGALEVVRRQDNLSDTSDIEVTLTPAAGSCTATCTTADVADDGAGHNIWGPSGIDFTDASTWFLLTEYLVDTAGDRTDLSPYTMSLTSSTYTASDQPTTFDGDGTNGRSQLFSTAGVLSGSDIYRYQIGQLLLDAPTPADWDSAISQPTALYGVALSDSKIRWYFQDNSTNESGFRLVQKDGESEILIDEVPTFGSYLNYIDEVGLNASEQYCGRVIHAYTSSEIGSSSELDCVSTLGAGEVRASAGIVLLHNIVRPSEFTISSLKSVARRAVNGDLETSTYIFPIEVLSIFLLGGTLHVRRKKKIKCSGKACNLVALLYSSSGVLIAVVLFAVSGWMNVFSTSQSSPARINLSTGEEVTSVFQIVNEGNDEYQNLTFEQKIPDGLNVDPSTLEVYSANSGNFYQYASIQGDELTVPIESLKVGETIVIRYSADAKDGFFSGVSFGTLTNEIFDEVKSNKIWLYINLDSSAVEDVTDEGSTDVTNEDEFDSPIVLEKINNSSTVYWVDDYARRPFLNYEAFKSWFALKLKIKTVGQEELFALEIGDPLFVRPGTYLVKLVDSSQVYAVEPNMTLRHIPNEQRALELYGEDWANRVLDIDPVVFTRYTLGSALTSGYPEAYLITDGTHYCQMVESLCRFISYDGRLENFFQEVFFHKTLDSIENYPTGEDVRGFDIELLSD